MRIFYFDWLFFEKSSLLIFWCEGLGSFLKRTFSGHGNPEVNRWSNISLISLSDSTSPEHLIMFIWPWLYIQFYEIRLFFDSLPVFPILPVVWDVSTLKISACTKVDIRLFHGTIQNHTSYLIWVSSWYKRQFWSKLIYVLYWKSWMHRIDAVFCQNQGPRSLIWYDFRFLNLQNNGPTVTFTNFLQTF